MSCSGKVSRKFEFLCVFGAAEKTKIQMLTTSSRNLTRIHQRLLKSLKLYFLTFSGVNWEEGGISTILERFICLVRISSAAPAEYPKIRINYHLKVIYFKSIPMLNGNWFVTKNLVTTEANIPEELSSFSSKEVSFRFSMENFIPRDLSMQFAAWPMTL